MALPSWLRVLCGVGAQSSQGPAVRPFRNTPENKANREASRTPGGRDRCLQCQISWIHPCLKQALLLSIPN